MAKDLGRIVQCNTLHKQNNNRAIERFTALSFLNPITKKQSNSCVHKNKKDFNQKNGWFQRVIDEISMCTASRKGHYSVVFVSD